MARVTSERSSAASRSRASAARTRASLGAHRGRPDAPRWLLVARPDWLALSPLGPTQNSRFWGIGNQLETLLLGPLLAGGAIAARRSAVLGFAAFALFGLVLITGNRLGSDGGGAIVLGVASRSSVHARSARRARLRDAAAASATACVGSSRSISRAAGPDHLRSAFGQGLSGWPSR